MKFKSLFLLTISIFFVENLHAQDDGLKFNKKRFIVVSSSLALTVGGTYYYIQNSWWSDKKRSFHFDDGADLIYALNIDKLGHFMGGLEAADLFASSMSWAGMQQKKAIWYGAMFGSGLQLAIEIKDAYAPYWGFSKWDLAFGVSGSLWPVAQYYYDFLKGINFKFSYYKHSNIYEELERKRGKEMNSYGWQDDYPNQTYWITCNINKFIKNTHWPEWLNFAIGVGLDNTQYLNDDNTKTGGNNEWYIALDYDIPKLLKKWNSPMAKKVKHFLNYIHFPAPTIRISPKLDFYPLFL